MQPLLFLPQEALILRLEVNNGCEKCFGAKPESTFGLCLLSQHLASEQDSQKSLNEWRGFWRGAPIVWGPAAPASDKPWDSGLAQALLALVFYVRITGLSWVISREASQRRCL